jgi:suppressor for copper-sensitivity B
MKRLMHRNVRLVRRFLAPAILAVALMAGTARADGAASDWARAPESAVRLVSSVIGVGDAAELRLGLEFELQPGWKTYWRSPGDAGFPVTVDWSGSENLAGAEIAWPAPHRFTLFGLETFGYGESVLLPVAARVAVPGAPVKLRAVVDYLVCAEICIPYKVNLALDVSAGDALPSDHAQAIARFQAQVPGDGARHGLSLAGVALGGTAEAPTLQIAARSAALPFEAPDAIIEGPNGFSFGAPQVTVAADRRDATFVVPVFANVGTDPAGLSRAEITLTLVDGQRGLEQKVALPQAGAAPSAAPDIGGFAIVLIALLGGLILNVMPCVLPVLSLKLLGLVGHAGERAATRRGFLASSAGIVTAFLILAAALIALKLMGGAIGWGIQFQQPWFLTVMTLVLVLFAANLWGWFEVPLPAWVGRVGAGDHGRGLAGQFVTGMFATLLATPCSAPFVGTAVTFAFSRGAAEIVMIFAALGVGLASPYLLVAAMPGIARLLPRPGPWMVRLRRILGLLLAGTAVWLLTVLAAQVGRLALAILLAGLALILAALALQRRLPRRAPAAGVAAGLLLALLSGLAPLAGGDRPAHAGGVWRPFQEAAIAGLVAEGKTVFVDVTADWCVTCLVNKRFVLEIGEPAELLRRPDVVAMQADWTKPDDGIARYLATFGRYGIPFNVVYGPGAPEGVPLPELLSESAVLDAFARAAGSAGVAANTP